MNGNDVILRKWMVSEEELDDEQYKIRQLKQDNYLIEGCAGSGKTVLALQKAKEIQDTRQGTYLVIVYTKALRSFITDGVKSLELDPHRVCHYDNLDDSGFESADFVIVDEVQDFSEEEIKRLVKMAKKNFIFFGDDAQQLHSRKTGDMDLSKIKTIGTLDDAHHKKLEKNYRLPLKIAEFAKFISITEDNLINRCVKLGGDKPLISKYNGRDKELDAISSMINNEGWADVGILVPTNKDVEYIKNYYATKKFDVEFKYDEKDETTGHKETFNTLNFYSNNPKILTYHSSKGLQFEHVFLPFCEIDSTMYNYREALYVAVTRASENLFISYSNSLSPFILRISSSYYDIQNNINK
jgi:superfamily I DNA/RNA helicase